MSKMDSWPVLFVRIGLLFANHGWLQRLMLMLTIVSAGVGCNHTDVKRAEPLEKSLPALEGKVTNECRNSNWAAMVLADALGEVRIAGVFAVTIRQRQAIADLERSLIERIETDFDNIGRDAAWRWASAKAAGIARAESQDQALANVMSESPGGERALAQHRESRYRDHLQEAAKLLEPARTRQFVVECAAATWRGLYSDIISGAAK
jgi:hypothetical protein